MAPLAAQWTGDPGSSFPDAAIDGGTVQLVQRYLRSRADRAVAEPQLVEAWQRFYSAYDPLIRQLAVRRPTQDADLRDECQEVWRAVISRIGQYDPARDCFSAWLKKLVEHVLVDQARCRARSANVALETERAVSRGPSGLADLLESEHARQRVAIAMAELRRHVCAANYTIVYDHWLGGKSLPEIAVRLNLSVPQVRARHHRTMLKLGEILSRRP